MLKSTGLCEYMSLGGGFNDFFTLKKGFNSTSILQMG